MEKKETTIYRFRDIDGEWYIEDDNLNGGALLNAETDEPMTWSDYDVEADSANYWGNEGNDFVVMYTTEDAGNREFLCGNFQDKGWHVLWDVTNCKWDLLPEDSDDWEPFAVIKENDKTYIIDCCGELQDGKITSSLEYRTLGDKVDYYTVDKVAVNE